MKITDKFELNGKEITAREVIMKGFGKWAEKESKVFGAKISTERYLKEWMEMNGAKKI